MANEKFEKFKQAIGLNQDIEDGYEEDYEDDYYDEDEQLVEESYTPARSDAGSADVLVLDPDAFEQAPNIVNKLKANKTIVVNLKQVEYEEGKRIYDFLSGAVFALEGSLNHIAESVFILAPRDVSVSTQLEKPKSNDYEFLSNWEE